MKRVFYSLLAVLILMAGCVTKSPQRLMPIPINPEMAKTKKQLITRMKRVSYIPTGTTNILTDCTTGPTSITLAWCPSPSATNGMPLGYFLWSGVGGTTNFVPSVYNPTNPCGPALSLGTNYFRCYTDRADAGTNLIITISNLLCGVTNCFAVVTYDTNNSESDFSEELQFVSAFPRPNFSLSVNLLDNGQVQLQTKVCPFSILTIQYQTNMVQSSWDTLATNQVPDVYGNYYYIDVTAQDDAMRFYRMSIQ